MLRRIGKQWSQSCKSHSGSHSVTCRPAEVTFPPLPQPKAGTRLRCQVLACLDTHTYSYCTQVRYGNVSQPRCIRLYDAIKT